VAYFGGRHPVYGCGANVWTRCMVATFSIGVVRTLTLIVGIVACVRLLRVAASFDVRSFVRLPSVLRRRAARPARPAAAGRPGTASRWLFVRRRGRNSPCRRRPTRRRARPPTGSRVRRAICHRLHVAVNAAALQVFPAGENGILHVSRIPIQKLRLESVAGSVKAEGRETDAQVDYKITFSSERMMPPLSARRPQNRVQCLAAFGLNALFSYN